MHTIIIITRDDTVQKHIYCNVPGTVKVQVQKVEIFIVF